jgi:hypothetical protein
MVPFTPEAMRGILEKVLRTGSNRLRAEDVKRLTIALNAVATSHWSKIAFSGSERQQKFDKLWAAVANLDEADRAEFGPRGVVAIATDYALKPPPKRPEEGKGPKRWHEVAPLIANAFRDAVRPRNPTLTLGNSDQGSVARFVAAVVPQITGEEPTVAAVAARLKTTGKNKA